LVHIDGVPWSLKFANTVLKQKGLLGLCDPGTKILWIRRQQNMLGTLTTLIHEALHGYEDERDIEIDHKVIEECGRIIASFLIENSSEMINMLNGISRKLPQSKTCSCRSQKPAP
jgi:hypothetical protein